MQPLNPEPLIVGGQEQVEGASVGKEALIIGGKKHNKTYKKKRHGNKSLTAWVKFVKKVAREEKLPYRDAMMRAKVRKDKGEKWMSGGDEPVVDGSVVDANADAANADADGAKIVQNAGRRSRRQSRRGSRRGSKKRRGSKRRR